MIPSAWKSWIQQQREEVLRWDRIWNLDLLRETFSISEEKIRLRSPELKYSRRVPLCFRFGQEEVSAVTALRQEQMSLPVYILRTAGQQT